MKWTNKLDKVLRFSSAVIWIAGILVIIVGALYASNDESVAEFIIGLIVGALEIEIGLNSLALKGTVMEMSYNLEKLTYYRPQGANTARTPNTYANNNGYANMPASYNNNNGYANTTAPYNNTNNSH
jgi:hypothetical protein